MKNVHFSFENSVCIVTGGTAGIGKEIALQFAEAQAHVVIVGTNHERGHQVEEEALRRFQKRNIVFMYGDVSKEEDAQRVIDDTISRFQKADILINNAGITIDKLALRMSDEDFSRVLDVNLKSCFYFSKAVLRPMLKQRRGKIISISSVVGLFGNAGQTNYAASKAGMIGFSKSLAREVASRNITVNCVAPGFIETSMTEVLLKEKREALLQQIPLGKLGMPYDVAALCLFLSSEGADYITGQVFSVDGGLVL